MMSVKLERVLDNLSSHYMPFTLLSRERLSEVVNIVRFVELREGEIMQIRGSEANDYLYVVEGHLEVIRRGSIRSFTGPEDTRSHPFILPCTGHRHHRGATELHHLSRRSHHAGQSDRLGRDGPPQRGHRQRAARTPGTGT